MRSLSLGKTVLLLDEKDLDLRKQMTNFPLAPNKSELHAASIVRLISAAIVCTVTWAEAPMNAMSRPSG